MICTNSTAWHSAEQNTQRREIRAGALQCHTQVWSESTAQGSWLSLPLLWGGQTQTSALQLLRGAEPGWENNQSKVQMFKCTTEQHSQRDPAMVAAISGSLQVPSQQLKAGFGEMMPLAVTELLPILPQWEVLLSHPWGLMAEKWSLWLPLLSCQGWCW